MLYREYEPTTWGEFVGQDKAVQRARAIIERNGFTGGAFWIEAAGANNSGVGKTTLARLIARTLADTFFIEELDGSKCDKAAVERMQRSAHLSTWGDALPYRVWIVNEAHAMTQGAVDAFLTFLEALPNHAVVIFTTTRKVSADLFGDHDSGPFASRCHQITLTNQGLNKAFAMRALGVATAAGLCNGATLSDAEKLVKACNNNLRATLQEIEGGCFL